MPGLDLRPDVECGGSSGMRARARLAPRQSMEAVADGDLHESVPCRMELRLIDAVAEAVVGVELGRVGVRLKAPGDRLLSAGEPSELVDGVLRPRATLTLERLAQGRVGVEEVVADERRRLVGDVVRAHAPTPSPCAISRRAAK